MALVMSQLDTALRNAGANEAEARAAAEDVADDDGQSKSVEQRIIHVEGRISLLQWMVGFNLAISVAVLFKLFV